MLWNDRGSLISYQRLIGSERGHSAHQRWISSAGAKSASFDYPESAGEGGAGLDGRAALIIPLCEMRVPGRE
jgi:hypothetical protein